MHVIDIVFIDPFQTNVFARLIRRELDISMSLLTPILNTAKHMARRWANRGNSLLMASPTRTPLAIRLTRARKAANLTLEQAAAYIGTSLSTYRRWENSELEPSVSQLVTAAVAFDTTPQALIDGTEADMDAAGLVQRVISLERTVRELQASLDALRDEQPDA
jgi:transcriptional regulator with XRE-family HTH domain